MIIESLSYMEQAPAPGLDNHANMFPQPSRSDSPEPVLHLHASNALDDFTVARAADGEI